VYGFDPSKISFLFARGFIGLALMFSFNKSFQAVQICSPEDSILLDPGVDCAERLRVEVVNAITSFAVFTNQVSPPKQTQVFRNCWTRNRECIRDMSGGLAAPAEKIEYGATRRIGECLKGSFLDSRVLICNRSVTHNV
jgi:hypothetical protein